MKRVLQCRGRRIAVEGVQLEPGHEKSMAREDERRKPAVVEFNLLERFLMAFVNLPFILVVPSLLVLVGAVGWAFVKSHHYI